MEWNVDTALGAAMTPADAIAYSANQVIAYSAPLARLGTSSTLAAAAKGAEGFGAGALGARTARAVAGGWPALLAVSLNGTPAPAP